MDNVRIEEIDKSIDWKDQYVKLLADYENAKKREAGAAYDCQKRTTYAMLNNILPIYWDFSRGVSNGWINDPGIILAVKNFKNFFTNTYKMKVIDKDFMCMTSYVFDEKYMSAVNFAITKDEAQDNTVCDIVSPGLINEQGEVVSFVKVIVYKYLKDGKELL